MNSIPKGIFIRTSDEGTDVFFVNLAGIGASCSESEEEFHIKKQHHIPKRHIIDLYEAVGNLMPAGTSVDFNPDLTWFVQHNVYEEQE